MAGYMCGTQEKIRVDMVCVHVGSVWCLWCLWVWVWVWVVLVWCVTERETNNHNNFSSGYFYHISPIDHFAPNGCQYTGCPSRSHRNNNYSHWLHYPERVHPIVKVYNFFMLYIPKFRRPSTQTKSGDTNPGPRDLLMGKTISYPLAYKYWTSLFFQQKLCFIWDDRHQRQQPHPRRRHQGAAGERGPGQRRDRPVEENHREADRGTPRWVSGFRSLPPGPFPVLFEILPTQKMMRKITFSSHSEKISRPIRAA